MLRNLCRAKTIEGFTGTRTRTRMRVSVMVVSRSFSYRRSAEQEAVQSEDWLPVPPHPLHHQHHYYDEHRRFSSAATEVSRQVPHDTLSVVQESSTAATSVSLDSTAASATSAGVLDLLTATRDAAESILYLVPIAQSSILLLAVGVGLWKCYRTYHSVFDRLDSLRSTTTSSIQSITASIEQRAQSRLNSTASAAQQTIGNVQESVKELSTSTQRRLRSTIDSNRIKGQNALTEHSREVIEHTHRLARQSRQSLAQAQRRVSGSMSNWAGHHWQTIRAGIEKTLQNRQKNKIESKKNDNDNDNDNSSNIRGSSDTKKGSE